MYHLNPMCPIGHPNQNDHKQSINRKWKTISSKEYKRSTHRTLSECNWYDYLFENWTRLRKSIHFSFHEKKKFYEHISKKLLTRNTRRPRTSSDKKSSKMSRPTLFHYNNFENQTKMTHTLNWTGERHIHVYQCIIPHTIFHALCIRTALRCTAVHALGRIVPRSGVEEKVERREGVKRNTKTFVKRPRG